MTLLIIIGTSLIPANSNRILCKRCFFFFLYFCYFPPSPTSVVFIFVRYGFGRVVGVFLAARSLIDCAPVNVFSNVARRTAFGGRYLYIILNMLARNRFIIFHLARAVAVKQYYYSIFKKKRYMFPVEFR